MNRVLFDTNVVSYWHSGERRFKLPLEKLFRELSKTKTTLYISSVTIQELGCWAMGSRVWPAVKQFLVASRLSTLPFCAGCAVEAAKLQVGGGPVVASRKSEEEEIKAQWHHDAAIVGTAAHHGLDLVVTTDRVLAARYGELFEEIRHIEPAL